LRGWHTDTNTNRDANNNTFTNANCHPDTKANPDRHSKTYSDAQATPNSQGPPNAFPALKAVDVWIIGRTSTIS